MHFVFVVLLKIKQIKFSTTPVPHNIQPFFFSDQDSNISIIANVPSASALIFEKNPVPVPFDLLPCKICRQNRWEQILHIWTQKRHCQYVYLQSLIFISGQQSGLSVIAALLFTNPRHLSLKHAEVRMSSIVKNWIIVLLCLVIAGQAWLLRDRFTNAFQEEPPCLLRGRE